MTHHLMTDIAKKKDKIKKEREMKERYHTKIYRALHINLQRTDFHLKNIEYEKLH